MLVYTGYPYLTLSVLILKSFFSTLMRNMLTGGRLYFGLTTADKHTQREFVWPNIYMQHNSAYVCQKVFCFMEEHDQNQV